MLLCKHIDVTKAFNIVPVTISVLSMFGSIGSIRVNIWVDIENIFGINIELSSNQNT